MERLPFSLTVCGFRVLSDIEESLKNLIFGVYNIKSSAIKEIYFWKVISFWPPHDLCSFKSVMIFINVYLFQSKYQEYARISIPDW